MDYVCGFMPGHVLRVCLGSNVCTTWLAGWLYLTNVPFDSLTIFLFCNCFFRWITLALYPKYRDTSESLLSAYSTMPLIVDLYVSCHCPCRALFSSFLSTDSVET